MLFVVVREVEGLRNEFAVFANFEAATECYEDAAYVVRNAPGEGVADDLTIITACVLYAADTLDPDLAEALAARDEAIMIESEEWNNRINLRTPNSN
ncbi:hypothetical protein [Rhodopila sp.]|uniref:hypothetical protein n=1 Tax=Rhodopila sp. TaxID=2480087 RepID=UPI003D0D92E4